MLAGILAAVVLLPAALLGLRVRLSEAVESVCWLTLGVVALAQIATAV